MAYCHLKAHTYCVIDSYLLVPMSKEPCPTIEAYKKDVDRTIIRENLRLTLDERVQKMISVLRFAEQLRATSKKP